MRMGVGWENETDDKFTDKNDIEIDSISNVSESDVSESDISKDSATLLLDLIADSKFTFILDLLLGFAKFGACTAVHFELA